MNKNLLLALCTTCLAFCTLYTPQPILPLLASEFGVSRTDAALLTTLTLAPLGVAPIVYGYFLQAIPARSMLRWAVFLLAVNQLAFLAAVEFWHVLALRFAQGLLMPAILTALMTYCATMAAPGRVRLTMGFYIGATIFGGFLSRTLGGVLAQWLGWQWAFAALGLMLLPLWALLRHLDADAEINFQRLSIHSIKRVLANPLYRHIYVVLSVAFLVFGGLLNLLPFRLADLDPSLGSAAISAGYAGYLVGIPAAIFATRGVRACGTLRHAIRLSLGLSIGALLAYMLPSVTVMIGLMFILAASMFFVHAALSGVVNDLATEHKGVVNGLYVSVYYLSSALGSWLLGFVYLGLGWPVFMLLAAAAVAAAALYAGRIKV